MIPKVFPHALAYKAAFVVLSGIEACCHRIAIAGSVRRKADYCHDVDLVLWPKSEMVQPPSLFGDAPAYATPAMLLAILSMLGWYQTETVNPKIIHLQARPEDGECGQVPVELYLSEPDGSNYEALLQMRTGCAEFNASLAIRAQKMSLQYKAGYGIFRQGVRVDDKTEHGIFYALGLDWIEPELRNGDYHQSRRETKR